MIEIDIYNILSVAVGSIFITGFYTPIQNTKNRLLDKLPDNYLGQSCQTLLSCPKCFSFIFSLLVFWSIQAAVLCSILAYFINHVIDRVEEWYQ